MKTTERVPPIKYEDDEPDEADDGGDTSGGSAQGRGTPKQPRRRPGKRKAADGDEPRAKTRRACLACQRAHLTCDDHRPCTRCVKRGQADTCTDGFRKKAKYLADVGDEVLQSSPATPQGLQRSITPLPGIPTTRVTAASPPVIAAPQPKAMIPALLKNEFNAGAAQPAASHPDPSLFSSDSINLEYAMLSSILGHQALGQLPATVAPSQPPIHAPLPTIRPSAASTPNLSRPSSTAPPAASAYASVAKPYDYRQGFHYLVHHIKSRMAKPDIMRICRALAHFRPSFMAQIMNLSEEDLVFMEKCFQRTLVEYEKLINCSGTPTVVWRRTGEIALVGKEFSLLTGWAKEQLLGKKTYIYELMDTESAVDYWEKFSLVAFDNSQQSVMTTCNLVNPQGKNVPCAFCFTIKRDIFDVPLAIVGAFLPSFDRMS